MSEPVDGPDLVVELRGQKIRLTNVKFTKFEAPIDHPSVVVSEDIVFEEFGGEG